MPDINDLIERLRTVKREINSKDVPTFLGAVVLAQTEESFKTERYKGDDTGKWMPRKAFGGERNINYKKLDYKGKLRRSFRRIITKYNRGYYVAEIGTNVDYAKMHNEGGSNGHVGRRSARSGAVRKGNWSYSGAVPQRQFLGVGSKTKRTFERVFEKKMREYFGIL